MVVKHRTLTCEYRYLFDTQIHTDRVRNAVTKNLKSNISKLITKSNFDPKSYENSIQLWLMKNVIVDKIMYTAYIENNELKIKPNETGRRPRSNNQSNTVNIPLQNGHSQQPFGGEWFGLYSIQQLNTVPNHIMIVIGCNDYLIKYDHNDPKHANHALCAFKHMDTLYCFNPWGDGYADKQENLPDNLLWSDLKTKYKCKHVIIYSGYNFQGHGRNQTDVGACSGYVLNFGTHMYNEIMNWIFMHSIGKNEDLVFKHFPNIQDGVSNIRGTNNNNSTVHTNNQTVMYFSERFNYFVTHLFQTYMPIFGVGTYHPNDAKEYSNALLKNMTRTPMMLNNRVNNFEKEQGTYHNNKRKIKSV